jgi:hypothetical protein
MTVTPPPLWVFQRRRDIELEVDLVLAGQLVFDARDDQKLSARARRQVGQIIRTLTILVRLGQLPDFAVVAGWRDKRPADANKLLDDDAALGNWCQDRYDIAVRVAPRGRSHTRLDSDLRRQMGVPVIGNA